MNSERTNQAEVPVQISSNHTSTADAENSGVILVDSDVSDRRDSSILLLTSGESNTTDKEKTESSFNVKKVQSIVAQPSGACPLPNSVVDALVAQTIDEDELMACASSDFDQSDDDDLLLPGRVRSVLGQPPNAGLLSKDAQEMLLADPVEGVVFEDYCREDEDSISLGQSTASGQILISETRNFASIDTLQRDSEISEWSLGEKHGKTTDSDAAAVRTEHSSKSSEKGQHNSVEGDRDEKHSENHDTGQVL